eukprot:TRINITY_DN3323_c1_g3_i2.p1 TRINITY_DN3323_c1_g3~~TRINITY_DN3323_c1_g3_i2.p1  ORF type:complete len:542 (-),score=144.82 TRINITY_DN3323_c1_g3_i2:661-2286(-)
MNFPFDTLKMNNFWTFLIEIFFFQNRIEFFFFFHMRLFVHVEQSPPFLLEVDDNATVEQCHDVATTSYRELYLNNPWLLKLTRVCRFIDNDLLLIYEKESKAQEITNFDMTSQETLSIYDEPKPTPTNPVFCKKPGDPNGIPVYRYSSLNRLIIYMTSADTPEYISDAFIHCFRQWTTYDVVLNKLFERYDYPEPANLLPADRPSFLVNERLQVQRKVCRTLFNYLLHYRYEISQEHEEKISSFISNKIEPDSHFGIALKMKELLGTPCEPHKYHSIGFSGKLALQVDPYDENRKKFWDYDAKEIAAQLTIMNHRAYNQLSALDFIGQKWEKKKHEVPALTAFIEQFEKLSNFICYSILTQKNLKDRKDMMVKSIEIMIELRKLNNFHSLSSLVTVFTQGAINRLTETYKEVPSSLQEKRVEYTDLCSPLSNYQQYRAVISRLGPEDTCIPSTPVLLKDFTFIEDGNPKIVKGLLNVFRSLLQFNIFTKILSYQDKNPSWEKSTKYGHLNSQPEILIDLDLHEKVDPMELFRMSGEIQPRR